MTPAEFSAALVDRIDPNCRACREAKRWASQHADAIAAGGRQAAEELLVDLASGNTRRARARVAASLEGHAWRSFMVSTTTRLDRIHRRRARLRDALVELGRAAAGVVGRTGLSILRGL